MKTSAATPLSTPASVLERVQTLEVVREREAEDPEQQDALGRAEVAAVDARDVHAGAREPVPSASGLGRCSATSRSSRGCSTAATSASAMKAGTIVSKAASWQHEQQHRAGDPAEELGSNEIAGARNPQITPADVQPIRAAQAA